MTIVALEEKSCSGLAPEKGMDSLVFRCAKNLATQLWNRNIDKSTSLLHGNTVENNFDNE